MLAHVAKLRRSRPDASLARVRQLSLRPADRLFHRIEICPSQGNHAEPLLDAEIDEVPSGEPWATFASRLRIGREDLHGFIWLRHLCNRGQPDDHLTIQRLTLDWIAAREAHDEICWKPSVVARRVISWLSEADRLVDGMHAAGATAVALSWDGDLLALRRWLEDADPSEESLQPAVAVTAALCCANEPKKALSSAETQLERALRASLSARGLHVSRSPSATLDVAISLALLRSLYVARAEQPPAFLDSFAGRIASALQITSLGSGCLPRFCTGKWGGCTHPLLSDAENANEDTRAVVLDDFYRLKAGSTVLLLDGYRPNSPIGQHYRNSALTLEVTAGLQAIFQNPPLSLTADAAGAAAARHNGLLIEAPVHHAVERGSDTVHSLLPRCGLGEGERAGPWLECSQTITTEAAKFLHRRCISLARNGDTIEGTDTLEPLDDPLMTLPNLEAAILFHLADGVAFRIGTERSRLTLLLPGQQVWEFEAEGIETEIETLPGTLDTGLARAVCRLRASIPTGHDRKIMWRLRRVVAADPAVAVAGTLEAISLKGEQNHLGVQHASELPPVAAPRMRTLREALARVIALPPPHHPGNPKKD